MTWWIKRDAFKELKNISSECRSALSKLSLVKTHFTKKVNFIKKVRKERSKTNPSWPAEKSIATLKGYVDEVYISFQVDELLLHEIDLEESSVLKELDNLIKQEQAKGVTERQLFFLRNPHIVEIGRILAQLISLLRKEKEFLEKSIKNPSMHLMQYFYEFEGYVREEAQLLGREEHIMFLLAEDLQKEGVKEADLSHFFVGYGSFMNAAEIMGELKTTLKKAYVERSDDIVIEWEFEFKRRVLAVSVHGFRRIFNKVATRGRWETEDDIKHRRVGVLNIEAAHGYFFNAVALRLTKEEFDSILQREKGYGQVRLKSVSDFKSGKRLRGTFVAVSSERYKKAALEQFQDIDQYLAYARESYSFGRRPDALIRPDILPIPHYLNTIREGVKHLDRLLGTKNMEKTFLSTTYLQYWDRPLKRDFGIINLVQYFRILEAKRLRFDKTQLNRFYRQIGIK